MAVLNADAQGNALMLQAHRVEWWADALWIFNAQIELSENCHHNGGESCDRFMLAFRRPHARYALYSLSLPQNRLLLPECEPALLCCGEAAFLYGGVFEGSPEPFPWIVEMDPAWIKRVRLERPIVLRVAFQPACHSPELLMARILEDH